MPPYSYTLPQRRLVSQDDGAIVERANVPRSRFINRWSRITAFDAAKLVPILVEEVLPGDHFNYNVGAYVRISTPLFPLFSNQRVDTFFFFVPNRLTWANWTKFMGEQANPDSSTDYTVPMITSPVGGYTVNSIADHMGLPLGAAGYEHSALPFRAYNLIYNTWFRDQNIINSVVQATGDTGADGPADYVLLRRAKSHDYFTSALPWTQKFTAPNVPLVGNAPILGIGFAGATIQPPSVAVVETGGGAATYQNFVQTWASTGNYMEATQSGEPAIYADLSAATGVAINTLRQAFMIQSLLERDARGGTRYTELMFSHFGVRNPDARLQRPEYIGGGQSPLHLTPIAQTAPTEDGALGALGAAGTATGQHRASYAATEHGYIIGLINVRTELAYYQGIQKHWSRETRYDFYFPALAQLGEQAILRKEIYATGNPANDDVVFGYQERWHEYRQRQSEVTGIMRPGVTGTLDAWHLAQNFASAPTLNATFINDTPPMDRVLAAGELAQGQQYLADIFFQRTVVRAIPTFGTPAILGRF